MSEKLPNWNRIGIALCVAPLATPVVTFILFLTFDFDPSEPVLSQLSQGLNGTLLMSLFTVPIAFIAILLGGIPAHLLLLKLECSSSIGYMLSGLAMVVMVHLLQVSPSQPSPDFSDLDIYAPYVLAVSWVAWYIAAKD